MRVSRGWGVAGSCDGRGVLGHVWDYMLDHIRCRSTGSRVRSYAESRPRSEHRVTCRILCWHTVSRVAPRPSSHMPTSEIGALCHVLCNLLDYVYVYVCVVRYGWVGFVQVNVCVYRYQGLDKVGLLRVQCVQT